MRYVANVALHSATDEFAGTLRPGRGAGCVEIIEVEAEGDQQAREIIIAEFLRRYPQQRSRRLTGLSCVPRCREY